MTCDLFVDGVTKSYHTHTAVEDISFEVQCGAFDPRNAFACKNLAGRQPRSAPRKG